MKDLKEVQLENILFDFKNYYSSGSITREITLQAKRLLKDFIPLAESQLEQLNEEINTRKLEFVSFRKEYDRELKHKKDYETILDEYQNELNSVQNPRELRDLRRKIRNVQKAMENQEAWFEKYPDESERMENSLSRLIEIKKLANVYVTGLKRDLNTGKLRYSPEGKTVLRNLFIGDKALYPINIKPILKANNITRAFKQMVVSEYELDWLWLCLNHYYGIRTGDDFAYAILERAGIKLDVSAYLKPDVVKEVIATQEGEAYLDKYFPAPNVFSSIPQKYIDAYMGLLLFYCDMDYGGSFGGTPKYADKMYKYCFNIISNDRKRMKMWREVCAEPRAAGLSYEDAREINDILCVQPELLENSTSALLKALDECVEKERSRYR